MFHHSYNSLSAFSYELKSVQSETVVSCVVCVCVCQEVSVRVSNTQLSQVSYWDLDKFEARLEQMRELYMVRSHTPDTNSKQTLANTFRFRMFIPTHVMQR